MKHNIGFEIKKTQNLICRYFDSRKKEREDSEITYTYRRIIAFIYRNGDKDIYQKDIEKEFSLRRSSASVLISKMEAGGLIERLCEEKDKRLKKIKLTEKAKNRLDKFTEDVNLFENMLVADIPAEEVDAFILTLNKIQKNISRLISEDEPSL